MINALGLSVPHQWQVPGLSLPHPCKSTDTLQNLKLTSEAILALFTLPPLMPAAHGVLQGRHWGVVFMLNWFLNYLHAGESFTLAPLSALLNPQQ